MRALSLLVSVALAGLPSASTLCAALCAAPGPAVEHHPRAAAEGEGSAHGHTSAVTGVPTGRTGHGAHRTAARDARVTGVPGFDRVLAPDCCTRLAVVHVSTRNVGWSASTFRAAPAMLQRPSVQPDGSISFLADSRHRRPPGRLPAPRAPLALRI